METQINNNDIGYIYCRAKGGLNDSLNQLYFCTLYAIKYKYNIILEFSLYNNLEISKVFDFTNYPVAIYPSSKLKELTILKTEPNFYLPYIFVDTNNIKSLLKVKFNKNKTYSKNILLIHDSDGCGLNAINVLNKIKLTPYFIDYFNEKFNKLPSEYNAIHFRCSDNLKFYKARGININNFKLAINDFIESSTYKVYIASDNKKYLDYINNKYNHKVITTKSCDFITGDYHSLHKFGNEKDFILLDCLTDLLILAKSNKIMVSNVSGYSQLAWALWSNKNIVNNLLNENNVDNEQVNTIFDSNMYTSFKEPIFNQIDNPIDKPIDNPIDKPIDNRVNVLNHLITQ